MTTIQMAKLSDTVRSTLQNNEVVYAGVFGSRAKGGDTKTSDYDFLVEFMPKKNIRYCILLVCNKIWSPSSKHLLTWLPQMDWTLASKKRYFNL